MILLKLKNGWPDRVISWDHSGPVPEGHLAFETIEDLDAWKSANPDLRPQHPPTPDPVPDSIPMWAFRRTLRKRGMLQIVINFINALPESDANDAMEHLEYGNYIHRDHPLIISSASALGLSDAVVDEIFRSAANEK